MAQKDNRTIHPSIFLPDNPMEVLFLLDDGSTIVVRHLGDQLQITAKTHDERAAEIKTSPTYRSDHKPGPVPIRVWLAPVPAEDKD